MVDVTQPLGQRLGTARSLSFSMAPATDDASPTTKETGDDLSPMKELPAAADQQSAGVSGAGPPGGAATSSKIGVYLRVRPATQAERSAGEQSCIGESGGQFISFKPPRQNEAAHSSANRVTSETYYFDTVFGGSATQTDIYDGAAKRLVSDLADGRSGLIFAFGITNAGKTHTVHGSESQPGLLPRAMEQLFETGASDGEQQLSMSYMEIYNDNVFDLLAEQTGKAAQQRKRPCLQLKEDERGNVFVKVMLPAILPIGAKLVLSTPIEKGCSRVTAPPIAM